MLRKASWLDEPHRSMFSFFTKKMREEFYYNTNDNLLGFYDKKTDEQEIERLYFGRSEISK